MGLICLLRIGNRGPERRRCWFVLSDLSEESCLAPSKPYQNELSLYQPGLLPNLNVTLHSNHLDRITSFVAERSSKHMISRHSWHFLATISTMDITTLLLVQFEKRIVHLEQEMRMNNIVSYLRCLGSAISLSSPFGTLPLNLDRSICRSKVVVCKFKT